MKRKSIKKARSEAEQLNDPVATAKAAGLHYVSDARPGIRRKRAGKSFTYIDVDGKRLRDPVQLHRIKSLASPPAWTVVWICSVPYGHIQATGRDARGRKQYRYHSKWRKLRDETKYNRMLAFGEALPMIRQRVAEDMAKPDLSRENVLATVVRLLETTLIRVGNEEYVRENRSFGLTTMRDQHVDIAGSKLRFHFQGKSGKEHTVSITDRRLAKIVKRCQEIPGYELFQYLDEEGDRQSIDSADVNEYLRQITGEDFTAKDFRTWAGTVLFALALQEFESFDSKTQAKKNVVHAIEKVAEKLGNTPNICRKCYIHPGIIEAYLDGSILETLKKRTESVLKKSLRELRPEEAAVLAFLQQRLARESEKLAVKS
ncbi:MAG TPA: DNA topoisomerase IB [Acidobacteriota bacterium]|nr:DNA topoisomerase IB [Acidobacteriota bacterium]